MAVVVPENYRVKLKIVQEIDVVVMGQLDRDKAEIVAKASYSAKMHEIAADDDPFFVFGHWESMPQETVIERIPYERHES